MPSDSAFVTHLLELLEPFGGVVAKRMFGGYGIFREGLMFALVADGVCYLKTDAENRAEFEAAHLLPFRFESRDGKVTVMSFCQCPETALDSPRRMRPWADSAFAAAVRNDRAKKRKSG